MSLFALRIPKAASDSLGNAVVAAGGEAAEGHDVRLANVPKGMTAIAILRDPVDRFRSAYDMHWNTDTNGIVRRYPSVDAFAEAGPDVWAEWGQAFKPSSWWLSSAAYVRKRRAIVIPYERMRDVLFEIGIRGIRPTHVTHIRHELRSVGPVIEHYAADYAMREALFGE